MSDQCEPNEATCRHLIQAGVWAGRAALAQGKLDKAEQALAHERELREAAEGYVKSQGDALRLLTKGNSELRRLREAAEAERDIAQDESDKWFAIAAAEQDVKALLDRNVKLRQWLESSDGMMANYERLASKYKHRAEAAEAERTDAYVLVSKRVLEVAVLTAYSSRLLAALTQQRQALDMARDHMVFAEERRKIDALAIDTAALLAEGETLGMEVQP